MRVNNYIGVVCLKIYKYIVGTMGTNSYILVDDSTKKAAIVDPGADAKRLLDALNSKNAVLEYIILTHGHFDHILALNEIKDKTAATILIHEGDADFLIDNSLNLVTKFSDLDLKFYQADGILKDKDIIQLGSSKIRVMHTPGHTPGSICLFTDAGIITGDTLFRESIGRYDFIFGDYDSIISSVKKLIKDIKDPSCKIMPGHGPSTTLAHELEHNVYLN